MFVNLRQEQRLWCAECSTPSLPVKGALHNWRNSLCLLPVPTLVCAAGGLTRLLPWRQTASVGMCAFSRSYEEEGPGFDPESSYLLNRQLSDRAGLSKSCAELWPELLRKPRRLRRGAGIRNQRVSTSMIEPLPASSLSRKTWRFIAQMAAWVRFLTRIFRSIAFT